jgi:hypothetical protein
MRHIGMSKKFSLLTQEAHLTKNALLSSFDLLLKANFFQEKDGYFYSGFFHLSIGLERLMKLVVVCDFMVKNKYKTPTKKELMSYGHNIKELYNHTTNLSKEYLSKEIEKPEEYSSNLDLINLLSRFGISSRYYNFDEISNSTQDKSPLEEWARLCDKVYREETDGNKIEREYLKIIYSLDKSGRGNDFTYYLNFDGNPMTVVDILYRQYYVKKATPIIIWKIITLFKPMYEILEKITEKGADYEIQEKMKVMEMPHFEDFFYFFLAMKQDTLRRKRWLDIFHG